MFCVRLCAVDDGRSAFPPLSGVSGDEAQNIIDRLPSMLACSLVRDAAGTQQRGIGRSNACRREVIPLRGRGFDPIASDRGDCLAVATWGGFSDKTDNSASSSGADYVLQCDQRCGAEQGEDRDRSAPQNISGRRT